MNNNTTQIALLVNDGGDGSANIQAYQTWELANFVEEHKANNGELGFGEPTIEKLSTLLKNVKTAESLFVDAVIEKKDIAKDLYRKFLKNKPNKIDEVIRINNYIHFHLNGAAIKKFDYRGVYTKEVLQKIIDNFIKDYCYE